MYDALAKASKEVRLPARVAKAWAKLLAEAADTLECQALISLVAVWMDYAHRGETAKLAMLALGNTPEPAYGGRVYVLRGGKAKGKGE